MKGGATIIMLGQQEETRMFLANWDYGQPAHAPLCHQKPLKSLLYHLYLSPDLSFVVVRTLHFLGHSFIHSAKSMMPGPVINAKGK